jgi:hypothetical protein
MGSQVGTSGQATAGRSGRQRRRTAQSASSAFGLHGHHVHYVLWRVTSCHTMSTRLLTALTDEMDHWIDQGGSGVVEGIQNSFWSEGVCSVPEKIGLG